MGFRYVSGYRVGSVTARIIEWLYCLGRASTELLPRLVGVPGGIVYHYYRILSRRGLVREVAPRVYELTEKGRWLAERMGVRCERDDAGALDGPVIEVDA